MARTLAVPTTMTFDLGANRHGQSVKLVRDPSGVWTIRKEAASQRDVTQFFELSAEQLHLIGLISEQGHG